MATPKRDTVYVDPFFYIPEGMTEWAYKENPEGIDDSEEVAGGMDYTDVETDISIVDETDSSIPDESLSTPTINGVVAPQVVRRRDDGTQVVDIVLDVSDVPSAVKYEVRITKLG